MEVYNRFQLGGETELRFENGGHLILESGTTRPASPEKGMVFFDTSLGQPVFYNGGAWVDALGDSI